jgi:hypothetical protein
MNNSNTARVIPTHTDDTDTGQDRILGGLEYLQQCLADPDQFAVVTGSSQFDTDDLLKQFLAEKDKGHFAWIRAATGNSREFLESLLAQFGFESFEATLDDLEKLVSLYLQHEASNGRPAIIVVQNVECFGPAVLNAIQCLAELEIDERVSVQFIFCGSEDLHRVLDSPAMQAVAARVRQRFNLAAGRSWKVADAYRPTSLAEKSHRAAELRVSLDGNLIGCYSLDREQLLIGRHEHNDVSIVSRFVSRHHALLATDAGSSYVLDLKSTNGTLVNSRPVTQHALRDGDVISIGNFRLKYCRPADSPLVGLPSYRLPSVDRTAPLRSAGDSALAERSEFDAVFAAAEDLTLN